MRVILEISAQSKRAIVKLKGKTTFEQVIVASDTSADDVVPAY